MTRCSSSCQQMMIAQCVLLVLCMAVTLSHKHWNMPNKFLQDACRGPYTSANHTCQQKRQHRYPVAHSGSSSSRFPQRIVGFRRFKCGTAEESVVQANQRYRLQHQRYRLTVSAYASAPGTGPAQAHACTAVSMGPPCRIVCCRRHFNPPERIEALLTKR